MKKLLFFASVFVLCLFLFFNFVYANSTAAKVTETAIVTTDTSEGFLYSMITKIVKSIDECDAAVKEVPMSEFYFFDAALALALLSVIIIFLIDKKTLDKIKFVVYNLDNDI